jgi:hypothetical protein
MLMRLKPTTQPSPETELTDTSTRPREPARAVDTIYQPDNYHTTNYHAQDQPTTMEEDHPDDTTPIEA